MLHISEHIEFRINGKLHGLHSIALLTYPKWLQNSLLPWYVLFNFSFLLFTQSVSPFRLNFVYLVFLEWLPSASRNFFDFPLVFSGFFFCRTKHVTISKHKRNQISIRFHNLVFSLNCWSFPLARSISDWLRELEVEEGSKINWIAWFFFQIGPKVTWENVQLLNHKNCDLVQVKHNAIGDLNTQCEWRQTRGNTQRYRLFSDNVLTSTVLCHCSTLNINQHSFSIDTLDAFQSNTGKLWFAFYLLCVCV